MSVGGPRLAALVAAAVLVGVASGCGGDDDRELVGLAAETPPVVTQDPLPDISRGGEDFVFAGPDDGLLLVYFGFMNCPDVCPGTLTAVKRAMTELGEEAERVSVAMVSVDPERDIPGLTGFVQSFVPDAHAVASEDLSAVRRLALSFGADFVSREGRDPEHTDALYAVDDQGRLLLTWPYPTDYDDIAGDIDQLLDDLDDA